MDQKSFDIDENVNAHIGNGRIRVAIIEPNPIFLGGFIGILNNHPKLNLIAYSNSADGIYRILETCYLDILICDVEPDDSDALEIAHYLKWNYPKIKIIVNGSHNPGPLVKGLLRIGVATFFVKGSADSSRLLEIIQTVQNDLPCYTNVVTPEMLKSLWFNDRLTPLPNFSEREVDVFLLYSKGLTKQEIASTLFISKATINYHLCNIFNKSEVNSETELLAIAYKNLWVARLEHEQKATDVVSVSN